MITLPQPIPIGCELHRSPILALNPPGLSMKPEGERYALDWPAAESICFECLFETSHESKLANLAARIEFWLGVRAAVELLYHGTLLIAHGSDPIGQGVAFSEGTYFGVLTHGWDVALPQPVVPVTFSGQDLSLIWLAVVLKSKSWPDLRPWFRWSWAAPEEPYRLELLGAATADLPLGAGRDLVKCIRLFREAVESKRLGGRPLGLTTWTREEFLEELPRAVARFEERHGRKPFDTELAVEIGVSKATFGRYKQRFVLADS